MTYELDKAFSRVVYHSVDLLHQQPGLPGDALLAAERDIVERADIVIASSQTIREHLHTLGRDDVLLWENVAHVDRFVGPELTRANRAIFAGNLTPSKIDFDLLLSLVESGVQLALAGPVGIDGIHPPATFRRLLNHGNTQYLGILTIDEMALEFRKSTLGLIPYILDDHTRGIFPMKTFEYLAAGLPVLSTELGSFTGRDFKGLFVAARTDFVKIAQSLVNSWNSDLGTSYRAAAQEHSWESRITAAVDLVGRLAD